MRNNCDICVCIVNEQQAQFLLAECKHHFLLIIVTGGDFPMECALCDKKFNSESNARDHFNSRKHKLNMDDLAGL